MRRLLVDPSYQINTSNWNNAAV